MIVTDIQPQKLKCNRVNIYIDGKFAFSLDLEQVVKHGVKINQELTALQTEQLLKAKEFKLWYDRILKFLSFRPRSRKEITDYLNRKKAGETMIRLITDKLGRLQLINDTEFAQWLIKQRNTFRPRGKQLLKRELLQKGISREIIDEVLSSDEIKPEIETAGEILQKKLPLWQKLPLQKQREKTISYLGRRGFGWDVINTIIKEIKA